MFDLMFAAVLDDTSKIDDFEEFVKRHERLMISVAYGVLNNYYDAEEAVSDAFVSIAKHFTTVAGLSGESQKAYACRSAKNMALNILEKRSSRLEKEFPVDEMPDSGSADPELKKICRETEHDRIAEIIEELSETYKLVLFMYFAEGMTSKEIAKALGLKKKTVQARITRGKRELLKKLKGGNRR